MGAAAIAALALAAASQASNDYGEHQAIKGQQQELNQENQIQSGYQQKVNALDAQQLASINPGQQTGSIGGIAANLAGQTAPVASNTAQAAAAAAASKPGANAGAISGATQGASIGGAANAALLARLAAPSLQLNQNRNRLQDWQLARARQQRFGQMQASNVWPFMAARGAGKGASFSGLAQLLALGATAAAGYKAKQNLGSPSTATSASTASPGASDLLADPNGSGYVAPNASGYVDPQTGQPMAVA